MMGSLGTKAQRHKGTKWIATKGHAVPRSRLDATTMQSSAHTDENNHLGRDAENERERPGAIPPLCLCASVPLCLSPAPGAKP